MTAYFSNATSAFQESVRLLLHLHKLTVAGGDESKEADDIRDRMDAPWHAMTEAEQKTIRNLSADLYTITEPLSDTEPLRPEFKSQINDALEQQRYAEALHLIRQNAPQLDEHAGAFLRGICWSGLALPSAAAEFFLHAERVQPGTPETRLCALSTLISGSREQEALDRAQKWAGESDDPSLVLKASEVVFLNAIRLPVENGRHLYEQTIELANRALELYADRSPDPATDEQANVAMLQIAVSCSSLGDWEKAREYSALARKRSPNSVVAITVDGMLNESAAPVGDAAKMEVARRIVGAPVELSEDESLGSMPPPSRLIRHVFSLN